ncbi:MAG: hypothetical protein KY475_14040 [Planctomycetes bacterium]|nr:hypothetical protein [Planctomycetota bacterium]
MLNELRTVLRCESEPATVTDDGETFAANVLLRIPEAHKVSVTICPDYRCPDPSLRVEIAGCGRKFARTLAANDEVRIKDLASQALAEVAAAIASRIEAAKH